MKRHFIAFLTPLVFALPAAADWPNVARTGFVAECVESAALEHTAATAQAFCECAADRVSNEFSAAELETLSSGAVDPAVQQRLIDASSSCAGELEES